MGDFVNKNVNYDFSNKMGDFDTKINSSSFVYSNSSNLNNGDVEEVDLDNNVETESTSSETSKNTWKTYEDAVAAGFSGILTKEEFQHRKASNSSEYNKYDSYEKYLNAMAKKYENKPAQDPPQHDSTVSTETADEVEETLKNMSKEDYDEFISEMKDNYNSDISQYEAVLSETEKILNRLDDGKYVTLEKIELTGQNSPGGYRYEILQRMYWFVQDKRYEGTGYSRQDLVDMSDDERIEFIVKYDSEAKRLKSEWDKAKKEYADTKIKNDLSDLGITTLDEYIKYRANLHSTKEQLEEAIKTTKNMRDSCYYDYLKYTKAYGDYKEYKPTDADKKDVVPSGNPGYYNYSDYKKNHPDVTPLEYIKMVKEKGKDLSYITFAGIENADELKTIAEVCDKYPDIAKTYNYLYKNDPNKLEDYFKKTKYELNNLEGQVRAEKFLSTLGTADGNNDVMEGIANELGVSLEGLKDGLTQFGEGVYYSFEAFMTAIGAWEENRTMSAEEYKRMYILYGLLSKEDQAKMNLITKDENGKYVNSDPNSIIDYSREYNGPALSNVYELTQGIGNMVPSMAISAAITYACPAAGICTATAAASAGATVGAVTAGISTGGNAYHNSMVSGASFKSSIIYGVYSGTSSAITQRVLGSIPFLSNVKVSSIATYLEAMGQQATQATVQGVLDGLAQAAILGQYPKNEQELQEFINGLFKSAAYGAITSGVLNLPALGTSIYAKLKFNKSMKNYGFTKEEIKSALSDFRKTHPECANMTDNELKRHYSSELFVNMRNFKINSIMTTSGVTQDVATVMFHTGLDAKGAQDFLEGSTNGIWVSGKGSITLTNAEQWQTFSKYINSGMSEHDALLQMLSDYDSKYVSKGWLEPGDITTRVKKAYDSLPESDRKNLSFDEFLKIKLQLVDYDPEVHTPARYAMVKQQMKDSGSVKLVWSSKDLNGLLSGTFGNGIGRGANGSQESATFAVPSSQLEMPDGFENWSATEKADHLGTTLGLDSNNFTGGAFEIEVDESIYGSNWRNSDPYTQGSNQEYVPGMYTSSGLSEVIIPRIDDVVVGGIPSKIQKLAAAGDFENASKLFFAGIKDGSIKLKPGVTIKQL